MVSLVSERMAIVAVAAFMPLHLWRLSYGVREERPRPSRRATALSACVADKRVTHR